MAQTTGAVRVLETAGPPTIYIPPEDVALERLTANGERFVCEWKGAAEGLDVVNGPTHAGWRYFDTFEEFSGIRGWCSFYPACVECWIGAERVAPQPSPYYGGWVTPDIVGPFKGEPGTEGL